MTVTITTARPGIIIGKGGSEVDRLKEELKKITGKEVQLNIFEIKRPELEAQLVAASIARQIESNFVSSSNKNGNCCLYAYERRGY